MIAKLKERCSVSWAFFDINGEALQKYGSISQYLFESSESHNE